MYTVTTYTERLRSAADEYPILARMIADMMDTDTPDDTDDDTEWRHYAYQ